MLLPVPPPGVNTLNEQLSDLPPHSWQNPSSTRSMRSHTMARIGYITKFARGALRQISGLEGFFPPPGRRLGPRWIEWPRDCLIIGRRVRGPCATSAPRACTKSPFHERLRRPVCPPPRFEVGDTIIHPATPDLVASCSPHVQRTWGTHSTTPPFLYTHLAIRGRWAGSDQRNPQAR